MLADGFEEDDELDTAVRVRLLRDTTRGRTAGYLPGLFQVRLRGNPQGGRFDPVRIHDLPPRAYDSAPGDQRWRLRVGDVVLRVNDRRITSFRTLDALLEYIRKQGRVLEVYVSASRRGERNGFKNGSLLCSLLTRWASSHFAKRVGAWCSFMGRWNTTNLF